MLKLTAVAAAGIVVVAPLFGCAMGPAGQGVSGKQPSAVAPSPPVTPSQIAEDPGLAVSPGDELFTFSATADTDYGARLDVTMVGHLPVEWDSPEGSLMIGYLKSKGVTTSMTDPTWDTQNNVSLGVVDVTVVAGGQPWQDGSSIQLLLGPSIAQDVVVDLPGIDTIGHFDITGPGVGHAIVAFPAFDSGPDVSAWAEATQTWGVRASAHADVATTFSNCSITLTELATSSSWVGPWSKPSGDRCFAGIAS